MSYEDRRHHSDEYLPHMQEIATETVLRVRTSTIYEDRHQNTDLVVFTADGVTFACRVRRNRYRQQYGGQFSIRYRLRSGAPTEWDKIQEGWGDWMIYGFAEPGDDTGRMVQWAVLNLHLLREYIKDGGAYRIGEPNWEDGSTPVYFNLGDVGLLPGLIHRTHNVDRGHQIPPFRETRPLNQGTHSEPRGPDFQLVGICGLCGSVTVRLNDMGLPRHADCEQS